MHQSVVDGAVVVFEPGPGFQWEGWDGKLTLRVSDHPMQVEGKPVAIAQDLQALGTELEGKKYKADLFKDFPGSVTSAKVEVEEDTLSEFIVSDDKKTATKRTKGTYTIAVQPSKKQVGPAVVSDPQVNKCGNWHVEQTGQALAEAEG